jgi:hypothetical protein
MPAGVKTETLRSALIGNARKKLNKASGPAAKSGAKVISKTEQKTLPPDLQRAVDFARKDKRIVTVDDAVASYAKHVSDVLGAVDKKGKGVLSEKEAKKITDPELRSRVLDVRTRLLSKAADGDEGGPRAVNTAKLTQAVDDMSEEWGSENIMDGIVSIARGQPAWDPGFGVYDVVATSLTAIDELKTDGTFDKTFNDAFATDPAPVTKAVMKELAIALNDDGFQYAQRDEVARITGQVETVIKALGGPAGLEYSRATQLVQPSHLDLGGDSVQAQVWSFVNKKSEDAVNIVVVKGTL